MSYHGPHKVCPSCGQSKPLTKGYWWKNRRSPDGFQSLCRYCMWHFSYAHFGRLVPTNAMNARLDDETIRSSLPLYREQGRMPVFPDTKEYPHEH